MKRLKIIPQARIRQGKLTVWWFSRNEKCLQPVLQVKQLKMAKTTDGKVSENLFNMLTVSYVEIFIHQRTNRTKTFINKVNKISR